MSGESVNESKRDCGSVKSQEQTEIMQEQVRSRRVN